MHDIVFKNAMIYDGTGDRAFRGNIAVKDGKITGAAPNFSAEGSVVLDLEGLAVAPGFIDIHSHSDTSFLEDERCQSKLLQGVTTELTGQCGASVYPCPRDRMENLRRFVDSSDVFDKKDYASASFQDFLEKVRNANKKMSVNLAQLIGHGALRAGVMGFEGRSATKEEIDLMCRLLEDNLTRGAWGLSLGLGYAPGVFADQAELNALGRVVARHGGVVTSHMRNQGDQIYEALEEMYEINRRAGAKVHIAHLKMASKKKWGTADALMAHIEKARSAGVQVTADMYPYTASSSGLTNVFPKWTLDGGVEAAAARLETQDRENIVKYLEEHFQTEADGRGLFIVTTYGRYPAADGRNIYDLSREWGVSMAEAIARLALLVEGRASTIVESMSEEDVDYLLRRDVAIGSDGYALPLVDKGIKPHPRSFGTFPRALRLVREKGIDSLESMVRRMTKKSADIIGLADRGLLKEGYVADITVFDPKTVGDTATYEAPISKPVGIVHVLIGGEFAVRDGEQTERRLGKFLLKK
jgi:N-acyl-D-amino-acid deacylase